MTVIRDIPGHPGYRVGDDGVVYSAWRLIGVWRRLKTFPASNGYAVVNLCGRRRAVHQLVLEAFVGPCPTGMECRHLDGDKQNNRLDNLAWGTRRENNLDRGRHGKPICGEANPSAKLTADQVRDIRALYAGGELTQKEIADRFGVQQQAVSEIVRGKKWKAVL